MNEISILEILGALGGFELIKWLITYFTHRKQEKRLKGAEVNKAESEAGKSKVAEEKAVRDMYEDTLEDMRKGFQERIKDLQQSNSELSKQNLELLKAGARKDDIIEDKKEKIRELQDLRVDDARRIGKLEKLVMFYKSWHCKREVGKGKDQCNRREPEQNPPRKFKPIDEND